MTNRSKMKYRSEYSQIVEDWRSSGLNRVDYCVAHGYHPNTFDGWIKKMSRTAVQSKSAKNKVKGLKKQIQTKESVLVPLKIENSPCVAIPPSFELHYPNGVILSMSSLPVTEDLSRIVHLYRAELCLR
jgi:hypothetical protein